MAGAQKKVVVRRLDGGLRWGYLPLDGLRTTHKSPRMLEWMGTDGRLQSMELATVQWVAYVRDFNLNDPEQPERFERRTYLARPRGDGLWVRLTLLGGHVLEGLTGGGLPLIDLAMEAGGLLLTPPDTRGNLLRLFVPRSAMESMEVLGWMSTRKAVALETHKQPHVQDEQAELFE
jgi:hypothetical protein